MATVHAHDLALCAPAFPEHDLDTIRGKRMGKHGHAAAGDDHA
jgi:hypothetical protein